MAIQFRSPQTSISQNLFQLAQVNRQVAMAQFQADEREKAKREAEKARRMQTIGLVAGAAVGGFLPVDPSIATVALGANLGRAGGGLLAGQTPDAGETLSLGLQTAAFFESEANQEANTNINNAVRDNAVVQLQTQLNAGLPQGPNDPTAGLTPTPAQQLLQTRIGQLQALPTERVSTSALNAIVQNIMPTPQFTPGTIDLGGGQQLLFDKDPLTGRRLPVGQTRGGGAVDLGLNLIVNGRLLKDNANLTREQLPSRLAAARKADPDAVLNIRRGGTATSGSGGIGGGVTAASVKQVEDAGLPEGTIAQVDAKGRVTPFPAAFQPSKKDLTSITFETDDVGKVTKVLTRDGAVIQRIEESPKETRLREARETKTAEVDIIKSYNAESVASPHLSGTEVIRKVNTQRAIDTEDIPQPSNLKSTRDSITASAEDHNTELFQDFARDNRPNGTSAAIMADLNALHSDDKSFKQSLVSSAATKAQDQIATKAAVKFWNDKVRQDPDATVAGMELFMTEQGLDPGVVPDSLKKSLTQRNTDQAGRGFMNQISSILTDPELRNQPNKKSAKMRDIREQFDIKKVRLDKGVLDWYNEQQEKLSDTQKFGAGTSFQTIHVPAGGMPMAEGNPAPPGDQKILFSAGGKPLRWAGAAPTSAATKRPTLSSVVGGIIKQFSLPNADPLTDRQIAILRFYALSDPRKAIVSDVLKSAPGLLQKMKKAGANLPSVESLTAAQQTFITQYKEARARLAANKNKTEEEIAAGQLKLLKQLGVVVNPLYGTQ